MFGFRCAYFASLAGNKSFIAIRTALGEELAKRVKVKVLSPRASVRIRRSVDGTLRNFQFQRRSTERSEQLGRWAEEEDKLIAVFIIFFINLFNLKP